MIVGIGVDLVDLARFGRAVDRTPRLRYRLFAESERMLPLHSLAGRYAAKEALIKALGGSRGVRWLDIIVTKSAEGDPGFTLSGSTAEVVRRRGITSLHLSMTHDAGVAIAFVVAERVSESELPENAPDPTGSEGQNPATHSAGHDAEDGHRAEDVPDAEDGHRAEDVPDAEDGHDAEGSA